MLAAPPPPDSTTTHPCSAGCAEPLRREATAAYTRLLLQQKLKLQGMLAVVGQGLVGPDEKVGGQRFGGHSMGLS